MRWPSPHETNERKLDQRGCANLFSTTLDTSSSLAVSPHRYDFAIQLNDINLILGCRLASSALFQNRLVDGQGVRRHQISKRRRMLLQLVISFASYRGLIQEVLALCPLVLHRLEGHPARVFCWTLLRFLRWIS